MAETQSEDDQAHVSALLAAVRNATPAEGDLVGPGLEEAELFLEAVQNLLKSLQLLVQSFDRWILWGDRPQMWILPNNVAVTNDSFSMIEKTDFRTLPKPRGRQERHPTARRKCRKE